MMSQKVLLNVRDPEKWYDSVIDTIWSPQCPEQNWSVRIFPEGRDFQAQARAFHKATMLPGVKRRLVAQCCALLPLFWGGGGVLGPCMKSFYEVPNPKRVM